MSWWSLIKVLGPVALVAAIGFAVADWIGLRSERAGWRACEAAAADPALGADRCPATLASAIQAAQRAAACDAALSARPVDIFALRASCSAPVKRTVVEGEAARTELADARAQIDRAQGEMRAAVARAEDRSTTLATRKARDDATISAAPRGADGLLRCDAECLRALGDAPNR